MDTMAIQMILLIYRRQFNQWFLKNTPGLPVEESSPMIKKESTLPPTINATLLAAVSADMDTHDALKDW